jgi:hypothetical protein
MFRIEESALCGAAAATVWSVLQDVQEWPEWYPGFSQADSEGPLGPGSRGSVTLLDGNRRPFKIYDWVPGEFFSLGGPGPGVAIRFRYGVTPIDGSHSVVRLGHTLTGIASPLFARIFGRRIAGYLPVAATQLARLAEKRSTAPSWASR